MSAIANFVVADATPTNHTLYPLTASLASSKWIGREATTLPGNRTLEVKASLSSKTRKTDRITVLYARPYEAVVDGVTLVSSIQRFAGEFVLAEEFPNADRNHFAFEVASVIANAVVKAIVKDRDVPY